MTSLQEIIRPMHKPNSIVQKVDGLSGLKGIAESIQNMNNVSANLTGLGGISEIARNMVMQKEKFSAVSILSNSLAAKMTTLQIPKNNIALSSLTGLGGISEITRNMAVEKEKFSAVSLLSNSLTAKMVTLQMPKNNFSLSSLTGLGGISEIARNMAEEKRKFSAASLLSNSLTAKMATLQMPKNNFALSGLTSSLSQIAVLNKPFSDRLANLATSQLTVTGNLAQIAQTIQQSHLGRFNTLNVALQGISSGFLKEIAISKTWEDFDVAEETNEAISSISEETLNQTSVITQKDLEEFRTSLLSVLASLLSKSKTERARQFLIDLIAVIGFLLTFYSVQQLEIDKSNSEVIIETKKELERISSEFSQNISDRLQKLNRTRTAKTNVNLRYAAKKNSGRIGLVKESQIVTVIEMRHKFLLISYLDFETGEPKSGFVMKKYFEIEK